MSFIVYIELVVYFQMLIRFHLASRDRMLMVWVFWVFVIILKTNLPICSETILDTCRVM